MNTPNTSPIKRKASPTPQEATPVSTPAKSGPGPVAQQQCVTPEVSKTKRYRPNEAVLAPQRESHCSFPRDFLTADTTRGFMRMIAPGPPTDLQGEPEEPAQGGVLDLLGDDDDN